MVAAASGARAATPPGRAWDLRPGVGITEKLPSGHVSGRRRDP